MQYLSENDLLVEEKIYVRLLDVDDALLEHIGEYFYGGEESVSIIYC